MLSLFQHHSITIKPRVMGATGTGKSTVSSCSLSRVRYLTQFQFINLISRAHLTVSDRLKSCTSEVQSVGPFDLDGQAITLVDTPGFDDTTVSDTDILKKIAVYLAST